MRMAELRDLAHRRQRGLCACCGRQLFGDDWELHHRRPGGMGGAKGRPGQQEPSNVLALRPSCHNLHPRSVHLDQQRSRPAGWLVSTHEPEPARVPVLMWGRSWVLLDDAGGMTPCAQPA